MRQREKTVLDVALSDEQIAEKQQQLVREMQANNRKKAEDQRAHEDRVQERIRLLKEKRPRAVDEIFKTMDRQKTVLDQKHRVSTPAQYAGGLTCCMCGFGTHVYC